MKVRELDEYALVATSKLRLGTTVDAVLQETLLDAIEHVLTRR